MRKLLFIFCLSFGIVPILNAQEIITDRPDQAEAAHTVPLNALQIETGTLLEIDRTHNDWTMLTSLFRYGYKANLEFRLETSIMREQVRYIGNQEIGINDLSLGFKYKFVSQKADWAMLGKVNFPNGSENVTDNRYSATLLLLNENEISDRVGYGINAGFDFFNAQDYNFKYAAALGFDLNRTVGFFAEVFGETNRLQADEFEHFFDCGFAFLVTPILQLDFSTGTGITNKYNFYSMGISYRIDN